MLLIFYFSFSNLWWKRIARHPVSFKCSLRAAAPPPPLLFLLNLSDLDGTPDRKRIANHSRVLQALVFFVCQCWPFSRK